MSTWDDIVGGVTKVVNVLLPLATVAENEFPTAAHAIDIGTKLVQGFMDAEPSATKLVQQIQSGTPPTPEQLQEWENSYEAAYQQLKTDIAEARAALPKT